MQVGHRVRTITDITDEWFDNNNLPSIPAGAVGTVKGKAPGTKDEGYMLVDFDDYFTTTVSPDEVEIMT